MAHIEGLDKYLTTEPEDNSVSYETFAEKVSSKLMRTWNDKMESSLSYYYDNAYSVEKAVSLLEDWEDMETEQPPVPQKKKLYRFVSQLKSTTPGEYYYLTSVFAWETFEEYVKAVPGSDDIVAYTKIPEELAYSNMEDLPF